MVPQKRIPIVGVGGGGGGASASKVKGQRWTTMRPANLVSGLQQIERWFSLRLSQKVHAMFLPGRVITFAIKIVSNHKKKFKPLGFIWKKWPVLKGKLGKNIVFGGLGG